MLNVCQDKSGETLWNTIYTEMRGETLWIASTLQSITWHWSWILWLQTNSRHINVNQTDTQRNQRRRMPVQMSWMSTGNKISVTKWIAQSNNVPIMIWSNTMLYPMTVLCQAYRANLLCSVNHKDSIVTVCRLFSSCTWNSSEVNITLPNFCESNPLGWGWGVLLRWLSQLGNLLFTQRTNGYTYKLFSNFSEYSC